MLVHGELQRAQVEIVGALPALKPKGRIVNYNNTTYKSDGTDWHIVPEITELQDFTAIGSLAVVNQQFAGRDYSLAELVARFGAPAITAYYRWASAGAGLLVDEVGTYALTNNNAATLTAAGIMGTTVGTDLVVASTQYYTQDTLFDTMPTALAVSMWGNFTEGKPLANRYLFYKFGLDANNFFSCYIDNMGLVHFYTRIAGAGAVDELSTTTALPSGVTGYYLITVTWDTTNGKRIFINGKLEAQNPTATVLPTGGVHSDMFIGATAVPDAYIDGTIANMVFMDKLMTEEDVDWLYASRYDISALYTLYGDLNFDIRAFKKSAVAGSPKQIEIDEVARTTSYLYRKGGGFASGDLLRLEAVR